MSPSPDGAAANIIRRTHRDLIRAMRERADALNEAADRAGAHPFQCVDIPKAEPPFIARTAHEKRLLLWHQQEAEIIDGTLEDL